MSEIAPPEKLAEFTRRVIAEMHSEWDAPHQFMTLHWDGTEITAGTLACITPDVPPADYQNVMMRIALEELTGRPCRPCAYLLQIEAYTTTVTADATAAERAQAYADHAAETIHLRGDAREVAVAYCADVTGQLWMALKDRAVPGVVEERFQPETADHLCRALKAVAMATGWLH
jgi:hypothetical protein